jgi:NitT/TauT family transport system substrate-binding protein
VIRQWEETSVEQATKPASGTVDASQQGRGLTRRRALGVAAAALAATTGLTGCTRREPLLRMASNVWPGFELMHAAQALGRFDETQLRLVEMQSSTDVLQALASGAIEGGGLTLDELLSARASGLDLCAVLVTDESTGADALVARPEIGNLAALAGRRIGVEQSATGALVLHAALQAAGLRLDQVEPVFMTVGNHLEAWQAHEVDALVTFEPVLGASLAQGAHQLFDSRAMPGQIISLMAVQQRALERSPQALRRLLQVHFELLAVWQHSPPQALLASIGARAGVPAEQVPALFEGLSMFSLRDNHQWLGAAQPRLLSSARQVEQVMLQAGLLTSNALPTPQMPLCSDESLPALPLGGRT